MDIGQLMIYAFEMGSKAHSQQGESSSGIQQNCSSVISFEKTFDYN
jgi:hypothetical protein